jgi:Fe-S-cluster containining protein
VAVVLDREPGQDLDPAFWRLREPVLATAARVGIIYHAFLPCSAHDPAAKACRAYDARPATCHAFPSEPGQVEGTPCSYYFEQDGVRRGGQGSPFPTPSRLLTLRPHA